MSDKPHEALDLVIFLRHVLLKLRDFLLESGFLRSVILHYLRKTAGQFVTLTISRS